MLVNYLSAAARLSKTFEEIAPGTYKENSYPYISQFSSIERNFDTVQDFYLTTVAMAAEGLCLLKGTLDRPLRSESRAGHTDSSVPTSWICLDVDYTVRGQTPDQFLDGLDSAFHGISFVFQYSASMGIKTHDGWRGHFFLLLDSPLSPPALKAWLISLNLGKLPLSEQIGLSASGGALTYPLDITTCQNDKLLYIAPPTCIGFIDPVPERFVFYKRSVDRLKLNLHEISAAHNAAGIKKKIKKLRAQLELPAKTFKTIQDRGVEILTNPDKVTVTGKKEARDFVYLNLNNGDSWAYYFPTNQPEVLYNFKGEPCMYLRDIDLELYRQYTAPTKSAEGSQPFGFLWPTDDNYYRGFADPTTGALDWLYMTGSKAKLKDFFVQNGVLPSKQWFVEEWNLEFNPYEEGKADFKTKNVNTYKSTEYMRNARSTTSGIPPTIDRVLKSICVEEDVKEYFINWLASIFQTKKKTMTAWIFQGVQGTGKGVLFSKIIAPLIGKHYCHEMTMDRLDDDFNGYLAENIILFIDEANIGDSRNGDRLLNRIKNLITESEQHIRAMRSNAVLRPNFSNVILASNYDEIIPLEVTDRRFNVAPRQETPINLEYEDIIQISVELAAFASYLHSYEVNREQVIKVMLNEARAKLIELSKTTIDTFFHSVKNGNLAYFTQYLDQSIKSDMEGIKYHDYAATVQRWVQSVGKPTNVSRAELRSAYQYLQNVVISTTKFSRMCNKYAFNMVPVRINGEVTRGISDIAWTLDADEIEYQQASSNVTSISRVK